MEHIQQVPSAFLKRYNAIIKGEKKLDTIKSLKDFWQFAIEQGDAHWQTRGSIAELTIKASSKANIPGVIVGWASKNSDILLAYDYLEANIVQPTNHETMSDKDFSDESWHVLGGLVNKIKV